jgi:hypothetical protein
MSRRLLAPLAAALLALLVALPAAGAAPRAHASVTCAGFFTVLHNDRIGATSFPAGPYTVTTTGLSCSSASALFARFLDDFDGVLPGGWTLRSGRTFTNGARSFTVTPVKPTPDALTCPGTFQVQHDDRIGSLALRSGAYKLTLLSTKGITCVQAAQRFAQFLDSPSGILPSPWSLNSATATFSTSATNGFKVERIGGGGGGRHPSNGLTRCPSTFRVLHDDRIGALRLPKGPYVINVFGGLTCPQATTLLRRFLAAPSGNLPAQWVEVPQTGTFLRGGQGFQVEPAF